MGNQVSNTKQYFYETLQFDNNYSVTACWDAVPTSFPTHWHTIGEIIYATDENSHFSVQEKEYVLNPGDILFIWPGELHATIHTSSKPYLILQYYNSLLEAFPEMTLLRSKLLSRHYLPASDPKSPTSEISEHMFQIRDTLYSKKPLNSIRLSLHLYHILLLFYDYCTLSSAERLPDEAFYRPHILEAVSNACCYISEHCDQDLSLNEVSEYVGISKFHFSRSFKEYTQISFSDYLAKQRIQKAILLFEKPDISISEVAFQSGFGSIASFNRCFKKEKSCTPSEYRLLIQKPH